MLGPHLPGLPALQVLVAVRDHGSFSAAGRALEVTQQAVSKRVRSIEAQVGAELVVRTPSGSALTETGLLVAGWAGEVIAAAERLDLGIESLRADSLGQLRIAASLTVAGNFVPGWLSELRREQARTGVPTKIELTAANSTTVISLVRNQKVGLGFVETPDVPADLRSQAVARDELVVVVAPDHRWARRRSGVDAAELARTPLVSRERGSGTRRALEVALLAAGVDQDQWAEPTVELSSTASVRAAIADGTAPGVVSALAVGDDLVLGRMVVVPVAGLDLHRSLTAIWRTTRSLSKPARDLLAIAAGRSGVSPIRETHH